MTYKQKFPKKNEVMDASYPYLRSREKKRITKNSRNDWWDKKIIF